MRTCLLAVLVVGSLGFGCTQSKPSQPPSRGPVQSPLGPLPQRQAPAGLDDYDVVWTTPSQDASGSMPIGNGEVGANVWIDAATGDLCCLLSRTDSFSEASRLLKLGTLRLHFEPAPFQAGRLFLQRLHLAAGTIRILAGDVDDAIELRLFVDVDTDVVHIAGSSARPITVTAVGDTWRRTGKVLTGEELRSSWTMQEAPPDIEVRESADKFALAGDGTDIFWGLYHHNDTSVVGLSLRHQGLQDAAASLRDPLLHRSFGLMLHGDGMTRGASTGNPVLVASLVRRFALQVAAPCVQDAREEAWRDAAVALLRAADTEAAFVRTTRWWDAFWARSWVFVDGDRPQSMPVPTNALALRVGADSNGQNLFHGEIHGLRISRGPEPRPDAQVLWQADPGSQLPVEAPGQQDIDLAQGFCITATVTQDAAHPVGRIVDKVTAGRGDGFLFDTHPGHALRLIVGDRQLVVANALPGGERHEVAASYDPKRGELAIYRDGKLLQSSGDAEAGSKGDPEPKSRLSRALLLQRWVQACGGRGGYPIKFNGSIFTVEPRFTGSQPFDADWRRWGDCFWWQNTRLPYYPMLAQGDFDMMQPLFALYERALPLAQARAKIYHGVEGAYFPETMTPFGTYANRDYGWDRSGRQANDVQCMYWRYAWNQGLELVALLLDRNDYLTDFGFVRDRLLPMADAVLLYFDARFPRDADGTLRITPTQALETYWSGVENDMPCVAGLHEVLARLLLLPPELLGDERAQRWQRLQQQLPPVPVCEQDGTRLLAPAGKYDDRRSNIETPELGAVFPFRLYGLGRPDIEMARAAYARRHDRHTEGWTQDGQFAALLGLTEEARANVLAKVRNANQRHRFPVMWGPNFDWLPDQDHGSNLLVVTQLMLLQPVGKQLLVLPSWPLDWDVSFRLHAPGGAVVTVEYRSRRLQKLEVTPAERRSDVRLPPELAAAAKALGLSTFER
jgi:hypothetical protein